MHKIFLIIILPFFISACSITQNIEPAEIPSDNELCIIENSTVREGFLTEFSLALTENGIKHKTVSSEAIPEECQWTATYTAKWSWDVTLYMAYAEIKIFKDGVLDGEAIYDSTSGSANPNKFIDAEPKIRELIKLLIMKKTAFFSGRHFV